jgi:hypothetical protein
VTYLDALLAGAVEPAIAPRTLPADVLASVPVETGEATEDVVAEPAVGAAAPAPRREVEPVRPAPPAVTPVDDVVERVVAATAAPTPVPVVDPPPQRDRRPGADPEPVLVEPDPRIEPRVLREVVAPTEQRPRATRGEAPESPAATPPVPAVAPLVRPAAPPPIEPRSIVDRSPPTAAPPTVAAGGAAPSPPPAPAINVRIGRIVVQPPAPRPRPPGSPPPAAVHRPLSEYLAERES